jgi:hypothetical protein
MLGQALCPLGLAVPQAAPMPSANGYNDDNMEEEDEEDKE